eukprot:COSAG02_NODE_5528_length_4253_cov_8.713288_4_plen_40_part_01
MPSLARTDSVAAKQPAQASIGFDTLWDTPEELLNDILPLA